MTQTIAYFLELGMHELVRTSNAWIQAREADTLGFIVINITLCYMDNSGYTLAILYAVRNTATQHTTEELKNEVHV